MEVTKDMSAFFQKAEILFFKHAQEQKANDFNVFSILRKESDEVNLHSAFLYELLNPVGSHNLKSVFLQKFFECANQSLNEAKNDSLISLDCDSVKVQKEADYVDILLTDDKNVLILENKIYAEDQPQQLERYYEKHKDKNVAIIYLTLYGDVPSDQSIGIVQDIDEVIIITLSYKTDILRWLNECLTDVVATPYIRETILQYIEIVKKLTGQTFTKEQHMEFYEMLQENNNAIIVGNITNYFNSLRNIIQLDFWKELEDEFEKCNKSNSILNLTSYQKYSEKKIEDFYKGRSRSKWYGLMYAIGEIDGDSINLFIEVENNIYYGVTAMRGECNREINLESKFDYLYNKIAVKLNNKNSRNKHWLYWKYPEIKVNFTEFNTENEFKLANRELRKEYIQNLCKEINQFVENVYEALNKER